MKKILIVDDCKEIRQLVKATFDPREYKVIEAQNGMKALESAKKNEPDLIIMDVVMPGSIDGIEAMQRIKDTPDLTNCKFIILSGSDSARFQDRIQAEIGGVFTKPFSPLDLISKVEQLLGSK